MTELEVLQKISGQLSTLFFQIALLHIMVCCVMFAVMHLRRR